MNKFKIYDWAGNELTRWGSFNTFDDGWDFILGELTDLLQLTEDDYSEYFVLIKE